jgi:hypothetical protein
MSRIFVHGLGAVSPAGWDVAALRTALNGGTPLPVQTLARPGWQRTLRVRPVPPPTARPAFLAHPRLRRASPLAQHAVASALEALGGDLVRVQSGETRVAVILCVMAGCVAYSRRFYEEVMQEPATASPLIFPETVFNAPASHLAAYLGTQAISYTLVGDQGAYLQGLALAADWLLHDRVDGVLVIGAEEMDWVVADALRLFKREAIHSHGAGAIYLKAQPPSGRGCELDAVTDSFVFTDRQTRGAAAKKMRAQLPAASGDEVLCTSEEGAARFDEMERTAWADWSGARWQPKAVLGEALTATSAWQCVAVCDAIQRGEFAAGNVSILGADQQAIGARFKCSFK